MRPCTRFILLDYNVLSARISLPESVIYYVNSFGSMFTEYSKAQYLYYGSVDRKTAHEDNYVSEIWRASANIQNFEVS